MHGTVVTRQVDAPAAGADWSFAPSDTDMVRLLTVTANLTTTIDEATRTPELQLQSQSGGVYFRMVNGTYQAPSYAGWWCWAHGVTGGDGLQAGSKGAVALPLPALLLQPGDTVGVLTGGLQAADQWSTVTYRAVVWDHWELLGDERQLQQALGG